MTNRKPSSAETSLPDAPSSPAGVEAEFAERYGVPEDEAALEHVRLRHLATARDPKTFEILESIGVGTSWRCLVAGAGAGTVSAWLATKVGEEGEVWSCDIDLQFHDPMPANVKVMEHDHAEDDLPEDYFSLIHARAVLQHIPERDAVLDKFIAALAPGGVLMVEEGHFEAFASQPLPEPYATMHKVICSGATTPWRDPDLGNKMLAKMAERGLADLDLAGDVWAMRPGESAGEWWFLALERAGPPLIAAGIITEEQFKEAMEQVRSPDTVMLSTLSVATWGRKP